MKYISALAALAIGIVLATGTAVADEPQDRPAVSNFDLDDLNRDNVELSSLLGKVVLINFWATWCSPCMAEMPIFQQYQEQYGDDLVVLAINADGPETFAQVRQTARRNRWTFKVLLDQAGDVGSILNPRGETPFTMILDRQGRLAFQHSGYSSGDEAAYEQWIQQLIAEPVP